MNEWIAYFHVYFAMIITKCSTKRGLKDTSHTNVNFFNASVCHFVALLIFCAFNFYKCYAWTLLFSHLSFFMCVFCVWFGVKVHFYGYLSNDLTHEYEKQKENCWINLKKYGNFTPNVIFFFLYKWRKWRRLWSGFLYFIMRSIIFLLHSGLRTYETFKCFI